MAKRTTKRQKKSETITIPHERPASFRTIYVDGGLVQTHGDTMILTFYSESSVTTSQTAELRKDQEGYGFYEFVSLNEERRRVHEAALRMKYGEAVNLALTILDRIQREAPELLEGRAFRLKTTPSEAEKET